MFGVVHFVLYQKPWIYWIPTTPKGLPRCSPGTQRSSAPKCDRGTPRRSPGRPRDPKDPKDPKRPTSWSKHNCSGNRASPRIVLDDLCVLSGQVPIHKKSECDIRTHSPEHSGVLLIHFPNLDFLMIFKVGPFKTWIVCDF